jgi:lysophospholipase L1-like esterase
VGVHRTTVAREYAADDFHPNDTGYGEWCAAFAEAIGLDGS